MRFVLPCVASLGAVLAAAPARAAPPTFADVTVSSLRTCAVLADGRVACWGRGDHFGVAGVPRYPTPTHNLQLMAGVADAVRIASGEGYACVVRRGGAVTCWRLGTVDRDQFPAADAVEVAVDPYQGACARTTAGGVVCWQHRTRRLRSIAGITGAVQIVPGHPGHGCALTAAHKVLCWSAPNKVNELRQLRGAVEITAEPPRLCARMADGRVVCLDGRGRPLKMVPSVGDAVALLGGRCARRATGDAVCWAHAPLRSPLGLAGRDGDPLEIRANARVSGLRVLAQGRRHACGIGSDGVLVCWGENQAGELGYETLHLAAAPQAVAGLPSIRQIAAGRFFTCALAHDGRVFCWGYTTDGGTFSRPTPTPVPGLGPCKTPAPACVAQLVAGGDDSLAWAIATDGTSARWVDATGERVALSPTHARLRAGGWLLRADGALVSPNRSSEMAPAAEHTRVDKPADVVAMAHAQATVCLVWRDGKLACRELASENCTEDECYETAEKPEAMLSVRGDVRLVSGAGTHLCIGTTDGRVHCRGENRNGALGLEGKEQTHDFAPVPGVDRVRSLATGEHVTCAARDDGRVLCWGNGRAGIRGGLPAATERAKPGDATPTLVPGIDDAQQVAVGVMHACVLRRTGQVACFGNNDRGELGLGVTSESHTPRRVTILDR